MNQDDAEIFLKYARNVKPIIKKNKLPKKIEKSTTHKTISVKKTKEPKTHNSSKTHNKPPTFLSIEKSKINKSLKRGQIPIDVKIDFHGLTILEAEKKFKNTITTSYKQGRRCILFITGKGLIDKANNLDTTNHSPRLYYGKIRAAFLEWIREVEIAKFVLNVEGANIKHGGDGAFYVYLRKNKH